MILLSYLYHITCYKKHNDNSTIASTTDHNSDKDNKNKNNDHNIYKCNNKKYVQ